MMSFKVRGDKTKKIKNVSKYYVIPMVSLVIWFVLLLLNLREPENSMEPFDDPKLVVSTIFGGIAFISASYLAYKNNLLKPTSLKYLNKKLK